MTELMERLKFAKGIDPVADAFAGTKNSDVYSMRAHGRMLFVLYAGVGATGNSVITVESCDDFVPTNTTAIPFWSREILSGDVDGAITRRAAAGFTNTVGSSKIVLVEVDAKDLPAGEPNVRVHLVESVDSPVLGGLLVIADGKPTRYSRQINATIIA